MEVNLNDVIESIEFQGELLTHFYNKKTGIIMYLEDSSTATYKAEDINNIDKFEEWEKELIIALNDLKKNPQDYIKLPDETELDEYNMMAEFAKSIDGLEMKNSVKELKEEIEKHGQINQWYDYREHIEYNIAKNWCERNHIKYIE